jgi:hypothetical protein
MTNGLASEPIAPFFTIWTEPRATIRRIVNTDPKRNVILLAALGGAVSVLEGQWSRAMSDPTSLSAMWPVGVALRVGFAALLGIVFLYLNGSVLRWSGALLGGTAESVEVRAAIAWGEIPQIVASVITILALLTGATSAPVMSANGIPKMSPQLVELGTVHVVLGLWGFVITLQCLAEVHRFSAWRALLSILIPLAILLVTIAIFLWLLFHVANQ